MRNLAQAFFLIPMLLVMLAMPARAGDLSSSSATPEDLAIIDRGTIKEILKSDMVMLDNNKRYRLDNILVPPYEEPPAMDELKREFLNKGVTVYSYPGIENSMDRYGLLFAHLVTAKVAWVQQDLVSKGLAWAFSSTSSPDMVETLKLIEEKARSQRVGFWKNPAYAIKNPENVGEFINSYQIVEGKIISISETSGAVFLNFGKNWKTDFAVKIKSNYLPLFLAEDSDPSSKYDSPLKWKNRFVRIRGWVTRSNGPLMVLTHKEQMDFLSQDGE
jgi:endonuclease YncB( thermonuclease family)